VLGRICSLLENMLQESNQNSEQLVGMGIGVPGPVDFLAGTLVSPPGMPGWDRYPITQTIQQWFPNTRIVIDNDVNAMALAEVVQGTGKGVDSIIFVKIGTGIGAGIICEGRIYRGANGCAGDIAHICVDKNGPLCYCGNKGCLEVFAAGQAFFEKPLRTEAESTLKDFRKDGGAMQADNFESTIGEGYAAGAEDIRESGQYIGDVLACLVNFYNPGMIVIGGGVIDQGSLLLSSIRERVFHRSLPLATRDLQIVFSEVGPDAGMIGTTNLALNNILNISACQALPIGA
jgi:glucokinase-like ROK family protein